jgi:hypothetical protein
LQEPWLTAAGAELAAVGYALLSHLHVGIG